MQTIHNAVNASLTELRDLAAKPTNVSVLPLQNKPRPMAMRRLWERMMAIYGHRWTSAFGEAPEDSSGKATLAGDTWARGLAGIAEQQIAKGLEACIVSAESWPPALPQFRAMCFGIPSLAEVKNEISKREKYQPFTRMVWANVDWFRYKSASADIAGFMLKEAYEIAREAVLRGEPMPVEPAASIDAPRQEKPVPAPPEVVEKHLKDLREILNIQGEVSCS